MENEPEVDIKYNLFESQRGMLLVYALTLFTALLIVDAITPSGIDPTALTAFGAAISAGFLWFFKSKGEEAKNQQP